MTLPYEPPVLPRWYVPAVVFVWVAWPLVVLGFSRGWWGVL